MALTAGAYLVLAITSPAGAPWSRVFTHPALRFFGRYSYGIYVFHDPLHLAFRHHPWVSSPPHLLGSQVPAAFGWCVVFSAVATGLAVLSWHGYEKHFLKLKARFPYQYPSSGGAPVG